MRGERSFPQASELSAGVITACHWARSFKDCYSMVSNDIVRAVTSLEN